MRTRSLKMKFAYASLLILGLFWLSGCAQNPRNVPDAGCCLNIPCVPCLFSVPLKTNQPDCQIAKESEKL